jgi:DNA-3-methyladenine glycosylase
MSNPLDRDFYLRSAVRVARDLLGARLVRVRERVRLEGIITETEAYVGEEDLACHAKAGRTPRTAIMYGQPGRAYVYFTYGMHWLLNAVTGRPGFPAAVLIRAMIPVAGVEAMSARRKGRGFDGPAKLTQALEIDGKDNGADLTRTGSGLWIEQGIPVPRRRVNRGPRIGLNHVPEPWKSKPWRFLARLDPEELRRSALRFPHGSTSQGANTAPGQPSP